MTIEILFAMIFLGGFGLLLFAGPSYIRKLRVFLGMLQSNHRSTYEYLREPSLSISNITIQSVYAVTTYVIFRKYLQLHDDELTRIGNSVRWRLIASVATMIAFAVLMPVASVAVK